MARKRARARMFLQNTAGDPSMIPSVHRLSPFYIHTRWLRDVGLAFQALGVSTLDARGGARE